jgi:hypothetical protein
VAAKLDEMQRSAEKGSTHLDLIEVIHAVHWPFFIYFLPMAESDRPTDQLTSAWAFRPV